MGVLILGGSGFIGGKVVKKFTKEKDDVISYDVIQSEAAGVRARFIRGDILEPLALERVFFDNDVHTVLHLVGLPDIAHCERDPQLSFYLNVLSLQNTLEPMRKANVEYIIFASSAAVYGYNSQTPVPESSPTTPNTVYGYHKMIGERLVESYARSYGLKYVILRLFNVYGAPPSTGKDVISIFIRNALANRPITLKGARKFRDFVHVDDVVDTIVSLSGSKPDSTTVNIGSGTQMTLGSIVETLKGYCSGLQVVSEDSPDDGTGIYADVSRLKSMVDFSFKDPSEGIEEHIRTYTRRGGDT
jgi:UDP-glucose 4-epimerase